jgi:hypothetical protein
LFPGRNPGGRPSGCSPVSPRSAFCAGNCHGSSRSRHTNQSAPPRPVFQPRTWRSLHFRWNGRTDPHSRPQGNTLPRRPPTARNSRPGPLQIPR